MTYLELCQEALRIADTGAPKSLSSFTDVSQYHSQVRSHVRDSWTFIQTLHERWSWKQQEFTSPLSSGQSHYAWSDLRTDPTRTFRDWLTRAPNEDVYEGPEWYLIDAGERLTIQPLVVRTYESMRAIRLVIDPTHRRPVSFAIAPDKRIVMHPTPDKDYMLNGMYIDGVQILANEDDVPRGIPEEYHDLIKWRAVMMLHASDESHDSFMFARRQFDEMLDSLERTHLPRITVGGALA